jgi:hypothetical protein
MCWVHHKNGSRLFPVSVNDYGLSMKEKELGRFVEKPYATGYSIAA